MAGMKKYLAFDLGAESGRAVLGTLDDGCLQLEEIHRFPNVGTSVHGSLYWDVLRLFDEMKRGLKLCVEKHADGIAGMGVDTWGVDFAILGPNDVLLENPHCYRDSRIDGMMEIAQTIVPRREIYEHTGIQFMPINTLYHMLSLARENRWMLESAQTMLLMPDLFNFFFTGVKVCEFTNATTTQFYDPREGRWAAALMERLDIPTHFLPEIVPPGTVLAEVVAGVAEETGAQGVPVVAPATHDTGSAVAAVPATGSSHAYISSGTWSLMGIESGEPIITDQALDMNFTNEGGVGGTFRVLRNIMGLWLVQESRRTWALAGDEYSYQQLSDMANDAPPYRSLIDPDHVSFLKPGDMPSRIREFCERTNQPVPEDAGSVVRCAFDSLALKYRWVLERLEKLTASRLDVIHMVGGGIKNSLLCQLAANVTRRPVLAGPVEATAIGNILVQAIALGDIGSLAEGREIVRRSFEPTEYEPHADSLGDDAYGRFLDLING